jgi:hypothetical protein
MPILVEGPNAVIASTRARLDTFLNNQNCDFVYSVHGTYISWAPGRDLNGVEEIEPGIGYIIILKLPIDPNISGYFQNNQIEFEYVEPDENGHVLI